MRILFITFGDIHSIHEHSLYGDLINEILQHHDYITVISPTNKNSDGFSEVSSGENWKIIKPCFNGVQKSGIIKKGIATILAERRLFMVIKKHLQNEVFDLVLYSTPPITVLKAIRYVKNRDHAVSFLMLKDIFPQNALDLNMLSKSGIRGLIYRYFRCKEEALYKISDYIGCTSIANQSFILKNNPSIEQEKITMLTNGISPIQRENIHINSQFRSEKGIPEDATVFFYGGNLGVPQDIPFLVDCLKKNVNKKDRYFIICGNGTSAHLLWSYIDEVSPSNISYYGELSKKQYDECLANCDVGMVFLDHRFTVPNCPARFYTYMEYGKPIIACTDCTTDIAVDIYEGHFGWWCESTDADAFTRIVDDACKCDLPSKGQKARSFLEKNYTVDRSYTTIRDAYFRANKRGGENTDI